MQIGGLGLVNTIVSSPVQDSSGASDKVNFSGLFKSLMMGGSTKQENASQDNGITKKELVELIQFLETEDILEIEGGTDILTQSMSDSQVEVLTLIKHLFGLGENESLKELVAIHQDSDSASAPIIDWPVESEVETEPEGIISIEMAEVNSALTQLLAMPMEELGKALRGDGKEAVKVIKLFELLTSTKDFTGEQMKLKELIQQLTNKLKGLDGKGSTNALSSETQKLTPRMEYLQKTFSIAAAVANRNAPSFKVTEGTRETKSGISKLDPINGLIQFQQMSKPEQLTLTLNQSGKPTTSSKLIKQFENILSKSQFSNVGGTQKLFIKLVPEHLGQLRIELIQKDSSMIARILTTTLAAKEALESQINGLKQAFSSQNIQVEKLEITQQITGQQERLLNKEQQQHSQHQGQGKQERGQRREEADEERGFNYSFEDALLSMEV